MPKLGLLPCNPMARGTRVLWATTVEPQLPAAWLWAGASLGPVIINIPVCCPSQQQQAMHLPLCALQVGFCEPLLPPLRRAARQAAAAMDRKPISDLVA